MSRSYNLGYKPSISEYGTDHRILNLIYEYVFYSVIILIGCFILVKVICLFLNLRIDLICKKLERQTVTKK